MTSKTNIYQMVADCIDEDVISDITDDNKFVNWMNRNYPLAKESLLSTGRWNFAKKRATLLKRTEEPPFEWAYWYTLPSGCLLLYPLTLDGSPKSSRVPFSLESGVIYTNLGESINIRFIDNVDEDVFHPLFTNYLVIELALRVAHWMSGKASYADVLARRLKDAKKNALVWNALNTDPEDAVVYDIDLVR